MAIKKETSNAADGTPAPTAPPSLAVYEVLAPSIKLGGVIAYRSARVNLTKEQAEALNEAQAETVKFIGI